MHACQILATDLALLTLLPTLAPREDSRPELPMCCLQQHPLGQFRGDSYNGVNTEGWAEIQCDIFPSTFVSIQHARQLKGWFSKLAATILEGPWWWLVSACADAPPLDQSWVCLTFLLVDIELEYNLITWHDSPLTWVGLGVWVKPSVPDPSVLIHACFSVW